MKANWIGLLTATLVCGGCSGTGLELGVYAGHAGAKSSNDEPSGHGGAAGSGGSTQASGGSVASGGSAQTDAGGASTKPVEPPSHIYMQYHAAASVPLDASSECDPFTYESEYGASLVDMKFMWDICELAAGSNVAHEVRFSRWLTVPERDALIDVYSQMELTDTTTCVPDYLAIRVYFQRGTAVNDEHYLDSLRCAPDPFFDWRHITHADTLYDTFAAMPKQ